MKASGLRFGTPYQNWSGSMTKPPLSISKEQRVRYSQAGLLTARRYTQDKEYVEDDEVPDVWHGHSESVRYQIDALIDTLTQDDVRKHNRNYTFAR